MPDLDLHDVRLHWRESGAPDGFPLVFANSLGTDTRLWDAVADTLPDGFRVIRFDKRGHGLSACPTPPYTLDDLVRDAEGLLGYLGIASCVFIGCSVGGMIGQALAYRRPGLIKALVLSNSAARMGEPQMWEDRIAAVEAGGLEAIADQVLQRWFSDGFLAGPEAAVWRARLIETPKAGYIGCCAAIAGADLTDTTSELALPALVIAGSEDQASPPELVRKTADMIRGAAYHCIDGAGHLPSVEAPGDFADVLLPFLDEYARK